MVTHEGGRPAGRGQHRRQSPARAGMLGASAAVAVGALALGGSAVVGSGGGDGDSGGDRIEAGDSASLESQTAGQSPTSESASPSPSSSPSTTSPKPSASPSTKAPAPAPKKTTEQKTAAPAPTTAAPAPTTKAPQATKPAPKPADTTAAIEAEVLKLVNQERSKAGCQPLTADTALAKLAGDFSADMAQRDFFDHTDPDGDDPWERAEAAGISNLGGENIARGQNDAQAVMDAWMASEGHRANILNCDFKTLGVGVYLADGGPWWTQDFGY
ncbi:CAP domain-containing protein [Streptomyces sp. NPDC051940]|uniref:CAP domain-containing protein n=1 Tax=Streptomyces sp. NPDC051940 TaxID=3155675 RepID=UPI003415963E